MRSPEFATLGSTLVVLGIVFSQDLLVAYSFIGAGVSLSIVSAIKLGRRLRTQSHGTGGV